MGGWLERYGALILLLTVLPDFGIVISPVAGANGVKPVFFVLVIGLTKLIRFWVIVLVVFGSARALRNWLGS